MISGMYLRSFMREERGVATVDWVALTASMMIFGLVVVYAVYENGVVTSVDGTNDTLETEFDDLPRKQAPAIFRN